jgi:hypothetical protein
MTTTAAGRTEGFWLSVPVNSRVASITVRVVDSETWAEALIDADAAGREAFVRAGYEDNETAYATLYQIGPKGGLIHSECFPIDGPDAG